MRIGIMGAMHEIIELKQDLEEDYHIEKNWRFDYDRKIVRQRWYW